MTSNEYNIFLKTNRLNLEVIRPPDLEFIYRGLSDEKVTRFYAVHFNSLKETEEQMRWYQQLLNDKKGIWWKLTEHNTLLDIGACGFNSWDHDQKKAEIGFWLLPEHQGRGFMSEAVDAILDYGFKKMGLKTIVAEVERVNGQSIKLLSNKGFSQVRDKTFREIKNNRPVDVDIFELSGTSRQ